jgi:hypothetical protein
MKKVGGVFGGVLVDYLHGLSAGGGFNCMLKTMLQVLQVVDWVHINSASATAL